MYYVRYLIDTFFCNILEQYSGQLRSLAYIGCGD